MNILSNPAQLKISELKLRNTNEEEGKGVIQR
jgi:hypothetical protein